MRFLAAIFLLCSHLSSNAFSQTVVVTEKMVPIQKKSDVLAWVPWGMTLEVRRTTQLDSGEWLEISAPTASLIHFRDLPLASEITGWIPKSAVVTATPADTRLATGPSSLTIHALTELLGDPIHVKELPKGKPLSHVEFTAALRESLAKLEDMEKDKNPEVVRFVKETRDELTTILSTARSLDENPIVRKLISNYAVDHQVGGGLSISPTGPSLAANYTAIFREKDLADEPARLRLKLAGATEQLQAIRIRLVKRLEAAAGKKVAVSPIIANLFCEPNYDKLAIKNISGIDLTNVIVYSRPSCKDASTHNLHYIPKLQAGEVAYAVYSRGIPLGDKNYAQQTLDLVDSVDMSVYSDQLSYTGYRYENTEEERKKNVRLYYRNLTLKTTFNPHSEQSSWGFIPMQFNGVPSLGKGQFSISFLAGEEWKPLYFGEVIKDAQFVGGEVGDIHAGTLSVGAKQFFAFDSWHQDEKKRIFVNENIAKKFRPKKLKFEFTFTLGGVSHSTEPFIWSE
jgi:hypothetical protein